MVHKTLSYRSKQYRYSILSDDGAVHKTLPKASVSVGCSKNIGCSNKYLTSKKDQKKKQIISDKSRANDRFDNFRRFVLVISIIQFMCAHYFIIV